MEFKYTGQNEVVSIGLYYYGARYYDPSIGRFITEDTYPGEMNNPQSQHLYVYVMNNPLRYIDPTGHMAKPVLYNGGGSWDEDDSAGGGSTQSPRRSKPKRNNTNIEKPNTSYNPITKSLKSFGEIAKGFWSAADERRKRAFDSPYDFANYMTIGILDATWAGAKARASKRYDSVYDFADWITLGTVDTFSGALNPDEAFSAEHWMDSLGAAAIVTGGIKMADKVAPGIVSVKDYIARVYDDLFKKKTMGAKKSPVVVGETMKRVDLEAAKYIDAKILNDMPEYWNMGLKNYEVTSKMMQYNRKWILEQLRSGRKIIDIGVDPTRKIPSIFYQMEQNMIKNYKILHPEWNLHNPIGR